jgi:hypothetical protein
VDDRADLLAGGFLRATAVDVPSAPNTATQTQLGVRHTGLVSSSIPVKSFRVPQAFDRWPGRAQRDSTRVPTRPLPGRSGWRTDHRELSRRRVDVTSAVCVAESAAGPTGHLTLEGPRPCGTPTQAATASALCGTATARHQSLTPRSPRRPATRHRRRLRGIPRAASSWHTMPGRTVTHFAHAAAVSATGYLKPASLAVADTSISTPSRRGWRRGRAGFLAPPAGAGAALQSCPAGRHP